MLTITDILRRHGAAYLAHFGDRVPAAHVRAVRDILACRTGELGGKRLDCTGCGQEMFVHFSCRNRACPDCHGVETLQWHAGRADEVLPVRYFHVVFTLPSQLRDLTRRNRYAALTVMMQTSAEALQELAADLRFSGGSIGILSVLHTWTRALLWHPHVHCLVPAVAVRPDSTWERTNPEFLVHVKALSKLFRGKFLDALQRALPDTPLPPGLYRHDWVSFCRPCGEGPQNVLSYVARYVYGGPMRGKRIIGMENGRYILQFRDAETARFRIVRLTPFELIRRFLQHTPVRGFHRMRYYGFWARSNRSVLRGLQLQMGPGLGEAARELAKFAEACAQTALYCPHCGSTMLVHVTAWRRTFTGIASRAPPSIPVALSSRSP